ncbi:MAG TPA: hypothetical protein GX534_08080 [Thermoanaerobacterales bacterium]|nr:hypothetical protein [Thermoanaerobacterales bacterium]
MTFKIFGIKTKINLFFILILFFGSFSGVLYDVIAAMTALVLHEFGHLVSAKSLGLLIEELEIMPFGGRIKIKNIDAISQESEIMVVLAGPMANFIASAFLLFFIKHNILPEYFGMQLINYQLKLGFFNLLPALPLDGGRLSLMWLRQRINFILAIKISCWAGKIIGLVLIFIAVWGVFIQRYFISFLLIGVFLIFYANKEEQNAPLIFIDQVVKKKEILKQKGFMPSEIITATENTIVKKILYLFIPQKYFIIHVLDDEMNIKKTITETEVFSKVIEYGLDISLKELL